MEMNAFLQAKQGASPAAFCIKTPPRVSGGSVVMPYEKRGCFHERAIYNLYVALV